MSEVDLETRIELLIANFSAMIHHLHELEKKIRAFEEEVKSWNN